MTFAVVNRETCVRLDASKERKDDSECDVSVKSSLFDVARDYRHVDNE